MNEKIRNWFYERPAALGFLRLSDSFCRYFFILSYVLAFLYTLVFDRKKTVKMLLVPGFTFISGSALRRLIDEERPYDKQEYSPLIKRDGTGKSFPSRHAFSGAVIAAALMWLCIPLGIIYLCIAIYMSILRVISGVHYIWDVAAGLLYGFVCGLIGFSFPDKK